MQGTPTSFWAKLEQNASRTAILAWHPLEAHCADVAACAEALLAHTLLRIRLAKLAGLPDLSPRQRARMCVLVALHDAGKYNHGFQNKATGKKPLAGHLEPLLSLLFGAGKLAERAQALLELDVMERWFVSPAQLDTLLCASISHHGHPVQQGVLDSDLWLPDKNGRDPLAGVGHLVACIKAWYPLAFEPAQEPIPATHAFVHAFNGLVMLADWMGSDKTAFAFAQDTDPMARMTSARAQASALLHELGLDITSTRDTLCAEAITYERFCGTGFAPRPAQQVIAQCAAGLARRPGSLMCLEADTGSGKTEAAILHFLMLLGSGQVDGLYFALPTRASATQIFGRVRDAIAAALPDAATRPPVHLAVPGYMRTDTYEAKILAPFQYQWPDEARRRGWAVEHPKRYLAGAVVVGTIDQVLLSSLMLNHAHMRGTALLRHLLVIDEVHASDTYMGRLVEEVLRTHLAAGGHALLMSATLGSALASRLLAARPASPPSLEEACALPYPLVRTLDASRGQAILHTVAQPAPRHYTIALNPIMSQPQHIARCALDAAHAGASVLIIRNTVRGCIAVQEALEALAGQDSTLLMRCHGLAAPHHARFAPLDRRALDASVEALLGKQSVRKPVIIVATQTVEQSLDIDADLLITDLCPADVLIQRLGRLHRHMRPHRPAGVERAHAIVLTPDKPLDSALNERGEARGADGIGTVYSNVLALEATRACLAETPSLTLPAMSRLLVERATHPSALSTLAQTLGGRWPAHWGVVSGARMAERGQASAVVLDRTKPYGQVFPRQLDEDIEVQTRLGEGDHSVRFEPAFVSPFGEPVEHIRLPAVLIRGAQDLPEVASHVRTSGEGTCFEVGSLQFCYNRHGLQKMQS